jgi:hypothetical protein
MQLRDLDLGVSRHLTPMQITTSWRDQRLVAPSMRLRSRAKVAAPLLLLLACVALGASAHRSLLLDAAAGGSFHPDQETADTIVHRQLLQGNQDWKKQVSGGCASILASAVYSTFYRAGKPEDYPKFLNAICTLEASTKSPYALVLPSPLTGESSAHPTSAAKALMVKCCRRVMKHLAHCHGWNAVEPRRMHVPSALIVLKTWIISSVPACLRVLEGVSQYQYIKMLHL